MRQTLWLELIGASRLFAAIGFGIVVLATIVACLAPRAAHLTATLDIVAGLLLVAGLAMIGGQVAVLFRYPA